MAIKILNKILHLLECGQLNVHIYEVNYIFADNGKLFECLQSYVPEIKWCMYEVKYITFVADNLETVQYYVCKVNVIMRLWNAGVAK